MLEGNFVNTNNVAPDQIAQLIKNSILIIIIIIIIIINQTRVPYYLTTNLFNPKAFLMSHTEIL